MTNFERIGINNQIDSASVSEARRNFRLSCTICCSAPGCRDCAKCLVAISHDTVVAALTEKVIHHTCCSAGCATDAKFNVKNCRLYVEK